MKTIFSDKHALQSVEREFYRGGWVEAFEIPRRAELVLAAVTRAGLGPVTAPQPFDLGPVLAVHDAAFVRFLEGAWESWVARWARFRPIPTSGRRAGRGRSRRSGPAPNSAAMSST